MQMAAASLCVIVLGWGVAGAAGATVFSQYVSGVGIFVDPGQSEIIAAGVHYLRIEGACYIGIGILFLLYGYYRAVNKPMMSVILTIASLGTRVALAYLLSATPLGARASGSASRSAGRWRTPSASGTTSKPKRHNETAGRRSKSGSLPAVFL